MLRRYTKIDVSKIKIASSETSSSDKLISRAEQNRPKTIYSPTRVGSTPAPKIPSRLLNVKIQTDRHAITPLKLLIRLGLIRSLREFWYLIQGHRWSLEGTGDRREGVRRMAAQ